MVRISAAVVGGVLLGILIMLGVNLLWTDGEASRKEVVRDILYGPKPASSVISEHRDDPYVDVTSVEDVITLPTEFARAEALYVIAGGAASADVQKMIFEMDRVADNVERISLQEILFFRLTELEPQTALELAKDDHFKSTKVIEQTVWRAWARNDLDDALFAAKVQISVADRNSAAQSLYAAFGYMGNETTDRIEAELGIGPDRSSRGRYLYRLADRSIADAINFINTLPRGIEQEQFVAWLANYVSLQDPTDALRHADLFVVASDGERYESIIKQEIARENPRAAIERLLASGGNFRMSREIQTAVRALVSTDPESAKRYFEQVRSNDSRRIFGVAIATQLAIDDPVGAIAWARENDTDRFPYLQMSVFAQISQTDPQLAITEALNVPNQEMRSSVISSVLQSIGRTNPADALVYLDQIPDQQEKLDSSRRLVSFWVQTDPDAAIDWLLSQDEKSAGQLIQMAVMSLVNSDLDAAIRVLPRVDKQNQASLRRQIAQNLAVSRSPEEAQQFIQQFEGQSDYGQLQASLISGVAQSDVLMAKQLADQLSAGDARDRAYMQVITQRAKTDPVEAARWLDSVSDESIRASAIGQLAAQWYAKDPVTAERWLNDLPAGSSRDDAIMQMSYRWRESTAAQDKLIASIENRDKRGQAKIRQVYNVMRSNPAKARELLEDPDISAVQRQQIEATIIRMGLTL